MKTLKEVVEEVGYPVYCVSEDGDEFIISGSTVLGDNCISFNPYYCSYFQCIVNDNVSYWSLTSTISYYESLKEPTYSTQVLPTGDIAVDISPLLKSHPCTCDFVSVILPYGCQCGGK